MLPMKANEEQVAFSQRASVSSFDAPDVRFIVERLTRGPEGVLDLVGNEARLVAALVERSESEANCATLIVLGLNGDERERTRLFARALEGALALSDAGPRSRLRVPLLSGICTFGPVLSDHGFAPLFVSYTMRTGVADVRESPIRACRFVDWSPSMNAEPVSDLVKRAFAGAHDVIPISVEDLHERLDAARPLPRLLFDGPELIGLCRTSAPGPDGVGRIPMLARDPSRRGQRLGDVLLGEAERVLALAGATRFELEVATDNRNALGLYERHGFEIASEETTWSRELRPQPGAPHD